MSRYATAQALSLFSEEEFEQPVGNWRVTTFSPDGVCEEKERQRLEDKYWQITEVTDRFNRQLVSYQLSKNDSLHRWLKYKEGFSAELVRQLLQDFKLKENDVVLDPFMGSGTTALVCCMLGINGRGYDILPMSKVSIQAKSAVYNYDVNEIKDTIDEIERLTLPADYTSQN